MSETMRKRMLDVYEGRTPDVVPYMLDLSHWFYHSRGLPWDLSLPPVDPEYELIDYYKKKGVGFYLPVATSLCSINCRDGVEATVKKDSDGDGTSITWSYSTPIGSIERTRVWEPIAYAWRVRDWALKTEQDLRVLGYAMSNLTFTRNWDRYQMWLDYVGDCGVVYVSAGYSAIREEQSCRYRPTPLFSILLFAMIAPLHLSL